MAMGLKALLTVDLVNATPEQRKVFDDEMVTLKWSKLKSASTTWKASFEDKASRAGAIEVAKSEVAKAALVAKVKSFSGAIQLAEEPVAEF
jgi:hypothetical protein